MKYLHFFSAFVFLACVAISTASAQWTIGGNDLSADGVLGSSIGGDPWDLIFVTQGSQRMKISSTGSSGAGDFSLSDPDATSQFEVRNVIKNKSLLVSNESTTNGYKYGIYNTVGSSGTGSHWGIYNSTSMEESSAAVNSFMAGINSPFLNCSSP